MLLLRLVYLFAGPTDAAYAQGVLPLISYGIGFFGILTCTIANLAAYRQNNVRRLLAYSSIAHAGYMLCAGAIVFRADESAVAPISAVIAYLMIYMFMNLGAFMSLGLLASDCGSERIDAFTGLGYRDWPAAASFTICLVSLIGLPPLGGFIVKWWLIYALGAAAQAEAAPLLWILVIAIVINSAISLFYYARILRQMYLRGEETVGGRLRAPVLGKGLVHLCAVILLLTGTILIETLKRNADAAAEQVYTASAPSPDVELVREGP